MVLHILDNKNKMYLYITTISVHYKNLRFLS